MSKPRILESYEASHIFCLPKIRRLSPHDFYPTLFCWSWPHGDPRFPLSPLLPLCIPTLSFPRMEEMPKLLIFDLERPGQRRPHADCVCFFHVRWWLISTFIVQYTHMIYIFVYIYIFFVFIYKYTVYIYIYIYV